MNKAALNILQRVLVFHFYRVNAGFFFFWFFLLFGVPAQVLSFHMSLIQGMIHSGVFLSCVIAIWFLYTLKCINYGIKQLNEPRQHFLFVLNHLSNKKQFALMLFVHMQVFLPVLVYACIVAKIAFRENQYVSVFAVVIANFALIIFPVFVYRYYLQKRSLYIRLFSPASTFNIPKPFFSIPLWFIWKERKQMLLVTKLFSLLLLYGFINLYEPDSPDVRPVLLIMLLIAMAHFTMVAHMRAFEENYLSFSRSLPVSLLKRFFTRLLTYTVLLLPELLFVWKGYPLHFTFFGFAQIFLLTVSILLFYHSVLLMNDIDPDGYFRIVFITGAVLFFSILYNPGILLPVFITAISFVLFHSHFYTFEKKHT